jgi:hypothetical protein
MNARCSVRERRARDRSHPDGARPIGSVITGSESPGSVAKVTIAERGSMRYTFHGGGPCDGAAQYSSSH